MKAKTTITLIWTGVILLGILVFMQLVVLKEKQNMLDKLCAKEQKLDEILYEKMSELNDLSTREYLILLARKHGFGFKNDKRFEER